MYYDRKLAYLDMYMSVYPLDVEIKTVINEYLKMETKEQVEYFNLENVHNMLVGCVCMRLVG